MSRLCIKSPTRDVFLEWLVFASGIRLCGSLKQNAALCLNDGWYQNEALDQKSSLLVLVMKDDSI